LRQTAGSTVSPGPVPGADQNNHEERGGSMRKLLGHLVPCAVLGVLLVTAGVGEAKAAFIFQIAVTVTDNTTSTTTVFGPTDSTGPDNSSALSHMKDFLVNTGTFDTSASGFKILALDASSNNPGSMTGELKITGLGQVNPGSTDSFTVTINTSETGYTLPTGAGGHLTASDSNTITGTTSATSTTQDFTSYYSPTNTLFDKTGPKAVAGTITTPATGIGSSLSGMSPTAATDFIPFVTPYALTNTLKFTIVGNGTGTAAVNTNSSDQFTGSTVVSAIPEPTSLVVFLTGMPLPLAVVFGLMRRRRGVAAG
jgi:hypothetical protein